MNEQTKTTTDDVQERYAHALMNTFGKPKLVLTRGEGARVWDAEGNEYLDLLGGIAVNALGHAHPALVSAVTGQLSTLGHVSNFFATEPQVSLAERLLALLDVDGRVGFANSGAEANEAALKLTRRTGRKQVVAAEGGFHGRTMGALSLTSKAAYREPFEPLPAGVTFDSATATQGSCLPSGGSVLCTLGTLANQADATVTIKVTPQRRTGRRPCPTVAVACELCFVCAHTAPRRPEQACALDIACRSDLRTHAIG